MTLQEQLQRRGTLNLRMHPRLEPHALTGSGLADAACYYTPVGGQLRIESLADIATAEVRELGCLAGPNRVLIRGGQVLEGENVCASCVNALSCALGMQQASFKLIK